LVASNKIEPQYNETSKTVIEETITRNHKIGAHKILVDVINFVRETGDRLENDLEVVN